MRKLGIDFTFVSPDATEEEIQAAFKPNTKAVFGETISNPSLDILDIERFAKVAHKNGVPLIVDNTFATPINCRVFDWVVKKIVCSAVNCRGAYNMVACLCNVKYCIKVGCLTA